MCYKIKQLYNYFFKKKEEIKIIRKSWGRENERNVKGMK